MNDEWGPWIDHDGRGRPLPKGTLVCGILGDGREDVWRIGRFVCCVTGKDKGPNPGYNQKTCGWSWAIPGNRCSQKNHVIRYRVRRPRGMQVLDRVLAQLPPDRPRDPDPQPGPVVPAEPCEASVPPRAARDVPAASSQTAREVAAQ